MYQIGDIVELIVNIPSSHLYAGEQGTIVHEHSPESYEIEFSDETGATLCTVALSPKQFMVIWESMTHQWVSVPMQANELISKLPEDAITEVLDFARFLVLRNNQKTHGYEELASHPVTI